MDRWMLDTHVLRDWNWRGWAFVAVLLALSLFGPDTTWQTAGAHGVTTLLSLVTFFLAWRRWSVRAMGVQIRIGVLILLAIGVAPSLRWVHAIPLVGVGSLLVCGYCPMERVLRLMPWNRRERLTLRSIARVVFSPPTTGGLLRPAKHAEINAEPARLVCSMDG
jgi:hypothetical protein